MKKKIYTIMSILLLTGICHAAPVIPDDKEEKENDKKQECARHAYVPRIFKVCLFHCSW